MAVKARCNPGLLWFAGMKTVAPMPVQHVNRHTVLQVRSACLYWCQWSICVKFVAKFLMPFFPFSIPFIILHFNINGLSSYLSSWIFYVGIGHEDNNKLQCQFCFWNSWMSKQAVNIWAFGVSFNTRFCFFYFFCLTCFKIKLFGFFFCPYLSVSDLRVLKIWFLC